MLMPYNKALQHNSRCPFSFRFGVCILFLFGFARPRPRSARLWLSFFR